MSSFRNIVFTVIVAVMLLLPIGNVVADKLLPGYTRDKESLVEARTYESFPKVNADTVVSGKFQSQFESYLSDVLPGRDIAVSANASLQKKVIDAASFPFGFAIIPTYFGSDYYSYLPAQRILPPPTAQPGSGSRAIARLDSLCSILNQSSLRHPEVSYEVCIVPQLRQDDMNPVADLVNTQTSIDKAWIEREWGGRLDDSIAFHVSGIEDEAELETGWFATDHHWTIGRALRTYNLIGSELGWNMVAWDEEAAVKVLPEWNGSDARRALFFDYHSTLYDEPTDFSHLEFFKIDKGAKGEPFTLGKRERFLSGELTQDDISAMDSYSDYYGNGHAWIENNGNGNGKTCLLISDSFGYNIRRYIAGNYQTAITIFPGNSTIDQPIDWWIDTYDVDDVVFLTHAQSYDFLASRSPGFLNEE